MQTGKVNVVLELIIFEVQ